MTAFVYNRAAKEMWDNTIALLVDTIKIGLSTSTHVPNRDDDFLDIAGTTDFTAGELTGTGYTSGFNGAGRKALASKTIVEDDTNDRAEFSCANITWTAINAGTAAQATVMKEITNDGASKLIANIDSGGFPKTTNGGDLTITVDAEGLIQLRTV